MLFTRRIDRAGFITINQDSYYVKQEFSGQKVNVEVDVHQHQFIVYMAGKRIKDLAIKHLYERTMTFQEYLAAILNEARTESGRVLTPRRI